MRQRTRLGGLVTILGVVIILNPIPIKAMDAVVIHYRVFVIGVSLVFRGAWQLIRGKFSEQK